MNKLDRFLKKVTVYFFHADNLKDMFLLDYCISMLISCLITIVMPLITLLSIILLPIFTLLSLINMIIKYDYTIKSQNTLKNVLLNWAKELHKTNSYYKLDTDRVLVNNKVLDSFIFDFIHDYNNRFDTITHYGGLVCYTGRRRSLGDIYLICKGYYPDCTIEDVFKVLIRMLDDRTVNGSYCTTINKFVFYTSSSHNNFDVRVEYKEGIKFKQLLEIYKNK